MKWKEKYCEKIFKIKANANKFADKLQKEGKLDVAKWEVKNSYKNVIASSKNKSVYVVTWTEILDQ